MVAQWCISQWLGASDMPAGFDKRIPCARGAVFLVCHQLLSECVEETCTTDDSVKLRLDESIDESIFWRRITRWQPF